MNQHTLLLSIGPVGSLYPNQASLYVLWIPQMCRLCDGDGVWVAGCDLIIAANFPNLCSGSRSSAHRDAALILPISQIWATFWVSPLQVTTPRQLSRGQIFSKQNCNLNHFSECTQLQLSHHQLIFITTKPVPSPQKLSNGQWAHTTNNNICGYHLIHILISIHWTFTQHRNRNQIYEKVVKEDFIISLLKFYSITYTHL